MLSIHEKLSNGLLQPWGSVETQEDVRSLSLLKRKAPLVIFESLATTGQERVSFWRDGEFHLSADFFDHDAAQDFARRPGVVW